MIKILLLMTRLMAHIVPLFGANKAQFTSIVSTKLKCDFRRSSNVGFQSSKRKNTFGKQLISYFFISFIFGVMIFNFQNPDVVFMALLLMLFVLVSLTLLTEFTTVLFNESDNAILLSRPVSSKTILVSRLGHIMLYIFSIVICFCISQSVFIAIKYSVIVGLLYMLSAMLIGWFSLLLTMLFFTLLSNVITGEKFKDYISYIQIAAVIIIMLVYQLVLNTDGESIFLQSGIPNKWYYYLLAPVWFAKVIILPFSEANIWSWISLTLIIVTAVWGGRVIVSKLAKSFDIILSNVNSTSAGDATEKQSKKKRWIMLRMLCINSYEKAGWKLVTQSNQRDRQFKQTIYPMLSYGFVFLILMVIKNFDRDFNVLIENLQTSEGLIMMMLPLIFLSLPISYIQYSKNAEASWVYHLVPDDKRYHLLSGAIKSTIVRFFIPPVILLSVIVGFIWGQAEVLAYLTGAAFVLLVSLAGELISRELPLSLSYDQISKGKTSIKMMGLMLLNGLAFWGILYLKDLPWGFIIGALLLIAVIIYLIMYAIREQ